MSKVLILDNYDSFTFNLFQYFDELHDGEVHVYKNDEISLEVIDKYDTIVLSPGPGLPENAGLMLDIINEYKTKKKFLGVCLGHQALSIAFGGDLLNLDTVYHGVKEEISILDLADPIYKDFSESTMVGKYHSWVVNPKSLPNELKVTSEDNKHNIMSFKHKELPLWGVQYHPESIMTEKGYQMISNFLKA